MKSWFENKQEAMRAFNQDLHDQLDENLKRKATSDNYQTEISAPCLVQPWPFSQSTTDKIATHPSSPVTDSSILLLIILQFIPILHNCGLPKNLTCIAELMSDMGSRKSSAVFWMWITWTSSTKWVLDAEKGNISHTALDLSEIQSRCKYDPQNSHISRAFLLYCRDQSVLHVVLCFSSI